MYYVKYTAYFLKAVNFMKKFDKRFDPQVK